MSQGVRVTSQDDTPIRSPFTNREMGWIDSAIQKVWEAHKTATASGYHNSYCKDYVRYLLRYVKTREAKSGPLQAQAEVHFSLGT